MKKLLWLTAIAVSVTGCATIQSDLIENGDYVAEHSEGITYFLPKKYFKIVSKLTEVQGTERCQLKLTVTELTVADTTFYFSVRPSHNIFREDEFNIAVNDAGLLDTVELKATDKSSEIIVNLAGAVASSGINLLESTAPLEDPPDCNTFDFERILDPAILSSPQTEATYDGHLIRFSSPSGVPDLGTVSPAEITAMDQQKNSVFFRRTVPLQMDVSLCHEDHGCRTLESKFYDIPQMGPIHTVSLESSLFVKSENKLTIADGMLSGYDKTMPSEALEISTLPIKVMKQIISAPTELLTLRIKRETEEKKALSAEQQTLLEELKAASLRDCLEKAGDDQDAIKACTKK